MIVESFVIELSMMLLDEYRSAHTKIAVIIHYARRCLRV
jgi:hypothetical protein